MVAKAEDDHISSASESRFSAKDQQIRAAARYSYIPELDEDDMELIDSHLQDRTLQEWLEILKESLIYHKGDPLIPVERMKFLESISHGPSSAQTPLEWEYCVRLEAFLFHEWSIYPEVRAVTRPIDEESDEGYHNFRVYLIGICWGMCGSVLATFFALRFPSISLGGTALQILIAFTGKSIARLPRICLPYWKNKKLVLNSGKPWSFKEQMLATLTMSVSNGSPYAQYAIVAQENKNFYGIEQANTFGYMVLLILSSAFMGFGFAGIFRSFLVYHSRMVWFSVLPYLTLARTLVSSDYRKTTNGWKLKRTEFFWLFSFIWFGWYWVVNTAAQFLQYFNWLSWITPDNVNMNAITGSHTGLGLNPVGSFDPNIFNMLGGILTPLDAYCNWMAGYLISFIAIIIMWYNNVRWTGFLPINSNVLFDNTGGSFQVRKIIDPNNYRLVEEDYQNYSLPFWSAGALVTYGGFFMMYTSMVVYSLLNYGGIILSSCRAFVGGFSPTECSLSQFHDSFSRRQARYKEVPEWWFLLVMACAIGCSIACVEVYSFTETPVWTIFLGIGLAVVFIPISGILQATTTYGFETNVLIELIIGYILPGNPNALMISKVFATNFFSQADNWITNQKQAHYAGISPRSLFGCQMVSTICTSFVQTGIVSWQTSGGIENLCDPRNVNLFTCQSARTYFNASVQWGTLGPKRVFEGLYPALRYCFLIGVFYPLPFWFGRKYMPRIAAYLGLSKGTKAFYWIGCLWLNKVNEVVILVATVSWAPTNLTYYLGDFYICVLFQTFIKRLFPEWWKTYAYLLISSLGNGYGYAGLFDFFATQYKHIVNVNWWGNIVDTTTMDSLGTAVSKPIPASGYFGPRKGKFP